MKANELRIGNLFIDEKSKTIISVIGLTEQRVTFSGNFKNDWQAKPIPLTEDWLIKLGFEKDEYDNEYDLLGFSIRFYEVKYYYNPISEYFPAYAIQINYVHELQNLFYAIKGKEIKK